MGNYDQGQQQGPLPSPRPPPAEGQQQLLQPCQRHMHVAEHRCRAWAGVARARSVLVGKDCTGLVTALSLAALGVPDVAIVDDCTPRMTLPTSTPTEMPWLGAWAARLGCSHVLGCSARRHGGSPGLLSGEARLDRRLPRLHQVRRGVESVAVQRTLVLNSARQQCLCYRAVWAEVKRDVHRVPHSLCSLLLHCLRR